jgi:hypothetical protein
VLGSATRFGLDVDERTREELGAVAFSPGERWGGKKNVKVESRHVVGCTIGMLYSQIQVQARRDTRLCILALEPCCKSYYFLAGGVQSNNESATDVGNRTGLMDFLFSVLTFIGQTRGLYKAKFR